jgi:predicted regulator of Ras-like GTPase activity (Roadblock/LC7/MglB family)
MKDVLTSLNKEVGVKGSMIVTRDGVVVAAEILPPLNSDQVAAIASNSIQRVNSALRGLGAKNFSRYLFSSSYGKMIFTETGDAYLVVVLDKHINIDFTMLAVASAARKIRNLGSMA